MYKFCQICADETFLLRVCFIRTGLDFKIDRVTKMFYEKVFPSTNIVLLSSELALTEFSSQSFCMALASVANVANSVFPLFQEALRTFSWLPYS